MTKMILAAIAALFLSFSASAQIWDYEDISQDPVMDFELDVNDDLSSDGTFSQTINGDLHEIIGGLTHLGVFGGVHHYSFDGDYFIDGVWQEERTGYLEFYWPDDEWYVDDPNLPDGTYTAVDDGASKPAALMPALELPKSPEAPRPTETAAKL